MNTLPPLLPWLAMIVAFNQQDGMSLFGLAIPYVKYTNSIIPALLMVPVQRLVEDFVMKFIPSAAHFTSKLLVITVIVAPLVLFALGPAGATEVLRYLPTGGFANTLRLGPACFSSSIYTLK